MAVMTEKGGRIIILPLKTHQKILFTYHAFLG
jgi:hypothetical protein